MGNFLTDTYTSLKDSISTIYASLRSFVLGRRQTELGDQRSRPDHPENDHLTQSVSSTENDPTEILERQVSVISNEFTIIPAESVPVNDVVPSSSECSAFYWACRNNDVETVNNLLKTRTQDEIDRIELNGSTALHAATYHGHADILQLLLDRGADRSLMNKFGFLPFDEAPNNEIRQLFLRTPDCNRLMNTGDVEWELVDDGAFLIAMCERQQIKSLYQTIPEDTMFAKIQNSYINIELSNMNKIATIKHFFEKAMKQKDPIWIIKAYTAETDFYNVLNVQIACGASRCQVERKFIIALLSYHPKLNHLTYIGASYRVMTVTDYHMKKYQINGTAMTKSFLSSSKVEEIAAWFLLRKEDNREKKETKTRRDKDGKVIKKSWVMCKYHIKHPRTALHVENSSQYTAEGEVLIMPFTVFRIINKIKVTPRYLSGGYQINVIEFEECDQYINELNP